MAFIIIGWRTWSCTRDEKGDREYHVTFRVAWDNADNLTGCGPASAQLTPGLPLPGDFWDYDGETDTWAFNGLGCKVDPVIKDGERSQQFDLEFKYTKDSCKDGKSQPTQDPLTEPMKISGSFTKFTEEAVTAWKVQVGSYPTQAGGFITNSAWEQLRGHQVEFDNNRPMVNIEQNVLNLQLNTISSLVDKVNDRPMWGLATRCVKLANVHWERKFYHQCYEYYTRKLEFEINTRTFDRTLMDMGTKALNGRWAADGSYTTININGKAPDPKNPAHFCRFKDRQGENCTGILDGSGLPYIPPDSITSPMQWWCFSDGVYAETMQLNCDDAKQYARETGTFIKGPFTDDPGENGCSVSPGTSSSDYQTFSPDNVQCPSGQTSGKGSIVVQKYQPANLFLLGIPTSL